MLKNKEISKSCIKLFKKTNKTLFLAINYIYEVGVTLNNNGFVDTYFIKRNVFNYNIEKYKNLKFVNFISRKISKRKKKFIIWKL